MRKFIIQFLLIIALMFGLAYQSYADQPTPASTCNIVTRPAPVQGGMLFYDSVGQGSKTVLLLHGLFADKAQWNALSCRLAAGYRAIVPDLPGYGTRQGLR